MPTWQRLPVITCCAIIVAMILAACGPLPPQELVFTVVETGQSDRWESHDPGLIVVAGPDDIAAVTPYITPDAAAALQNLNYDGEFALLVLRGLDTRIPAQDPIRRVVWWGNVVTAQMNLGEDAAATPTGSPYTLVRVEKGPHWGGAHTLRLVTPGTSENVMTQQKTIP